MSTLYILIGVPAAGKSTWVAENKSETGVVISSDGFIEAYARERGLTYDDVFEEYVGRASRLCREAADEARCVGLDVYWDQTNLGVKKRRGILNQFPKSYRKVAVIFPPPNSVEWDRRLKSRPGKTIPEHVLKSMVENYVAPTKNEGFDEIIEVK